MTGRSPYLPVFRGVPRCIARDAWWLVEQPAPRHGARIIPFPPAVPAVKMDNDGAPA